MKKIHILKDSRGLGVQIAIDMNHVTREKGVFVSDVNPGGAAARLKKVFFNKYVDNDRDD